MPKYFLAVVAMTVCMESHADKVGILSESCITEKIVQCLTPQITVDGSCPSGFRNAEHPKQCQPSGEVAARLNVVWGDGGNPQANFERCKAIQTLAWAKECTFSVDIPNTTQIEQVTKIFNENFMKALEKAFPQPVAAPEKAQPVAKKIGESIQ